MTSDQLKLPLTSDPLKLPLTRDPLKLPLTSDKLKSPLTKDQLKSQVSRSKTIRLLSLVSGHQSLVTSRYPKVAVCINTLRYTSSLVKRSGTWLIISALMTDTRFLNGFS